MDLSGLTAISPIDGRYRKQTLELAAYFSEFALIKYRVLVEIEYFISLSEIPLPQLKRLDKKKQAALRSIYLNFSESDAEAIKEIEKTTNHDVKAVEYFVKNKLEKAGLHATKEFVHFGLTSQDINNTAIPLSLKDSIEKVLVPELKSVITELQSLSKAWKDVSMLARTHGQPASPTKLGKEINVYVVRLQQQLKMLSEIPYSAKFGGATGNLNAHHVAYPQINWNDFAKNFVEKNLKLKRSFPTTQIEHYDNLAAICDAIKRINTIILDLNRDMWSYIAMDYFKQKIKKGEIGSSAMPHKVNPIDFENSEGNIGIANALFEHLASKLPVSRLQRDLTDSTVLRNLGVPFAHTLISLRSLKKGLGKLILNKAKIDHDLNENWSVVAEAIQTVLRRECYANPYEALKELTRTHEKVNQQSLHVFIDSLKVSDKIKKELKKITPFNYTGI